MAGAGTARKGWAWQDGSHSMPTALHGNPLAESQPYGSA